MGFIWWTIGVVVVIIWCITLFDIVRSRLGAGRTAAWVLLVLILPIVGSVIYWFMREPEPGEAQHAADAERDRRERAQRGSRF